MFCCFLVVSMLFKGFAAKQGYTASVYEHATFLAVDNKTQTRRGALEIMRKNLAVYQMKAKEASSKGAEIIVFPEDGLYGFLPSREGILPFLETIPNPSDLRQSWNPCLEPARFIHTEVLRELSCIAHNSSIAVVANMGDVQYCDKSEPHCPHDGRYQFNTDVAFDTDGSFLAKYHKQHLYHEEAFNTPLKAEIVTFETSFGITFGVFTCFDMLFFDPAIELVEKRGIRDIVFPTAWMDGFPILASVEYQQAWSRRTGVNLLAANQHHPIFNMVGSGIYSCGEAIKYVYDTITFNGHLLVAHVENSGEDNCPVNDMQLSAEVMNHGSISGWQPVSSDLSSKLLFVPFNSKPFHSILQNDIYTFIKIEGRQGNVSVCSKKFCCQASYSTVDEQPFKKEMFALGAFSGHHTPEGYFIQTCALIKCSALEEKSCGQETLEASTVFKSFSLIGNFSPKAHVYPEVLASRVQLISPKEMQFLGHQMIVMTFNRPLVSAVLFGRVYEWDPVP